MQNRCAAVCRGEAAIASHCITLTQQEYNKGRRLGMPKRGYDKEEGL